MKKTLVKILCVAMVFAMLIPCFASCGEKNTAFKIGATGPLTGEAASYGISVKNGAELAIKHVNAKGGIQFEFNMLDDKAGATDAATNYATLYDWGMQFSLGGVTSGAGEAFAKAADIDNVFCMTPSGSADPVIDGLKYSFRLCFGDPDQGTIAADEIKKGIDEAAEYDITISVGCIYDESDTYSSGIYAAFKARMEALQIPYEVQTFDAENKVDFSTQADALKDCDIIFMPFYYTEASLFIKKAVEKQSMATFFGCDGFDGIADKVTDVENLIMYITPFDVDSEEDNVKAFVAAYEAEYGKKPDQFAADAYDVVMAYAAALEAKGVTDYDLDPAELATILYDALTDASFSYDGLTGKGMKWSADGKCTKAPKIVYLNAD